MGLVKTRRLAAMQKQQRAIHLRQGYGGLKAGMKPPVKTGLPPHFPSERIGSQIERQVDSSMQRSTAKGLLNG